MKKIKINYSLIYILLVLCMSDGLFYIFNERITLLLKNFSYLLSIPIFFLSLFLYFRNKDNFRFKILILSLIFLSLIQPINTYIIYGQEFSLGYFLNLKYLLYLNYFFISYYINKNNLNILKLENLIIKVSILASTLYILQYYLLPKIILSGIGWRINYRFGEPRFYISTILFAITFILALIKLMFVKSTIYNNFKYIFCIILNFFVLIQISKTRSIMIALIICCIIIVFIKIFKTNPIKSFIFLFVTVFLFIGLMSTNTIKNMIALMNSGDNSLSIRSKEITFYLQQFKSNCILGRGEIDRELFPYIDGIIYRYYLDDLGFIGIIVKFGIFGILGIIYILINILKIIFTANKESIRKIFIVVVSIYILIVGLLIPYIDQGESIICICIFLSYIDYLMNNEIKKC